MYSVSAFGSMIADEVRMSAYVQALEKHVTPDSVVLDIGTGTGIFALLACRFGARKVYAIEPNEAIQVARELAAANGYADRIEFIEDLSTRVTLPEQANVILADLRGVLPLYDHNLPTMLDARARLLAPGGVMIPQRDSLWAALVSAPDLYEPYVKPWEEQSYGLNTQAARRIVINSWGAGRAKPEQMLTSPQLWTEIDYTNITDVNAHGELAWTMQQAGTAHGLCVWFDTVLTDGIGFSNAPGGGAKVYGSAFFPLNNPIDLELEDRVTVQLRADLVSDDYVWSWNTLVKDVDGAIKSEFKQSTFFSAAISPKQLRKQADNYVPHLNETGQMDQFILSLMGGDKTHGEIARLVFEQYPHRFQNWRAALTHVAKLAAQYSD
ncbi:MAG TPA: 50S ribosomal protein L11 methyltransferase [Blastocatellia bacterium]|nr:50S ribosomal protein L11 methyltransferase [Blastocatellia bacterium]